ncbi:hypothetical protein ACQE32_03485 [Pantoea sp. FN0302]|uniref:hypothetical protein n=1 Tax=unclassified Pantoea TaxID=2630326 RepID=UPI003CF84128
MEKSCNGQPVLNKKHRKTFRESFSFSRLFASFINPLGLTRPFYDFRRMSAACAHSMARKALKEATL